MTPEQELRAGIGRALKRFGAEFQKWSKLLAKHRLDLWKLTWPTIRLAAQIHLCVAHLVWVVACYLVRCLRRWIA